VSCIEWPSVTPKFPKPPHFLHFASPFVSSQSMLTEILNLVDRLIAWSHSPEISKHPRKGVVRVMWPILKMSGAQVIKFGGRGLCPCGGGGAGSPSKTMWPGPRPTTVINGILIHPTVWPQYTKVTDRTGQSDSIWQTVSQRVAQKLIENHMRPIKDYLAWPWRSFQLFKMFWNLIFWKCSTY